MNERVVGNAQFVQQVKDLADVLVVVDHHVVVFGLPTPGLTDALRLHVGAKVHVGGIDPDEERLAGLMLALNQVNCRGDKFIVNGLHALLGQRAGIFDFLRAACGWPSSAARPRGPNLLPEVRKVLFRSDSPQLRLFLGVQVIQVAEEFVEAVHGRQNVHPGRQDGSCRTGR